MRDHTEVPNRTESIVPRARPVEDAEYSTYLAREARTPGKAPVREAVIRR